MLKLKGGAVPEITSSATPTVSQSGVMDVSTNCRTELLQRLTKSLRNVALEPDTAIATIVRHLLLADALTSHPDDSEAASNATRAWFDGLKSLLDSKNVSDVQPNVLASI